MKTHPVADRRFTAALLLQSFLAMPHARCLLLAVGLTVAGRADPPADFLGGWPAGAAPAKVGRRVAENFQARPFLWQTKERTSIVYSEVCAWQGALSFAETIGDAGLRQRLVAKYDVLLTPEGDKMISRREHVDFAMFGALPLEIYRQMKAPAFLSAGLAFADTQWATTTPDGITAQARYWIDDVYMINILQTQAFRATRESKYLDRAALMTAAYLDKLQQPNGLFYHADDSRFFWSRGNGWFAAGMAELLPELPADHPQRARILAGFRQMMTALLKYQGDDGLWRQLIDHPDFWPETSGTGMFAFAMTTGIKQGWLDAATYGPAVRRAWLGLVAHLDADANLHDVCDGTNKAAMVVGADSAAQLEFYRARARITGNLHGQAPLLWTATALLR